MFKWKDIHPIYLAYGKSMYFMISFLCLKKHLEKTWKIDTQVILGYLWGLDLQIIFILFFFLTSTF